MSAICWMYCLSSRVPRCVSRCPAQIAALWSKMLQTVQRFTSLCQCVFNNLSEQGREKKARAFPGKVLMHIPYLEIHQVRNLRSVTLDCHSMANIVYGINGSGKTSLLESLYLLGRGRSFRHRDLRLVVSHQADELVVSAKVKKIDPSEVVSVRCKAYR